MNKVFLGTLPRYFLLFSLSNFTTYAVEFESPKSSEQAYALQEKYKNVQKKVEETTKRLKTNDSELAVKKLALRRLSQEGIEEGKEELQQEIERLTENSTKDQKELSKTQQEELQIKTILSTKATQDLLKEYSEKLGQLINQPQPNRGEDSSPQLPLSSPLSVIPEDVVRRTAQELSLWQRVQARVSIFLNENKASLYEMLGNKKYVAEIRKNLDGLYAQFGTGGLLARAKNYKKLVPVIDTFQEKVKIYSETLSRYQELLEKGQLSQGKKEGLVKDIQNIIVDSLLLAKANRQVAPETLSKEIDQKINAVLSSIINDPLLVTRLQERTGVKKLPLASSEIDAVNKKIIDDKEQILALLKNDFNAKNDVQVKDFWQKVAQLETNPIDETKKTEISQTLQSVYSGYRDILLTVIHTEVDGDKLKEAISSLISLTPRMLRQDVAFNDAFLTYVEQEGIPPVPGSLTQNSLTSVRANQIKKNLINKKDALIRQISDPKEFIKQYNDLNQAVVDLNNELSSLNVTADSLALRASILNDIYGEINRTIINPPSSSVLFKWPVEFFDDITQRIKIVSEALAIDQASLVKPSADGEGLGVVTAAERLPESATVATRTPKNALLAQILEGASLRKVEKTLPAESVPQQPQVTRTVGEILSRVVKVREGFEVNPSEDNDSDWD